MSVRPLHWVRRFLGATWPGRPSAAQRATARTWLSDAELALFDRMSGADQRHALGVAKVVDRDLASLDEEVRRPVMAAALLHDVGKTAAGLGTYGRAVATLCGAVARDMAEAWQSGSGFTRKVGLYLRYGVIGADMLRVAGSHEIVVAWSAEHHLAPEHWSIPRHLGDLLVAADR